MKSLPIHKPTFLKLALCIALTLILLLGSYWLGNMGIPLPGETKLMQRLDKVKKIVNSWSSEEKPSVGAVPEEVLLVNVCYDKQLVEVMEGGMPVGKDVVTDRAKLLSLLQWADSLGDYRYILLDVRFPRGLQTETDAALFRQILSMPRIVVPTHRDIQMQDSVLLAKAGRADYMMFDEETNFTRYQFLPEGKSSLPLRMYQELCGRTIEPCLLGYRDGGRLCSNAVTLQLRVCLPEKFAAEGQRLEYTSQYLGSQLLELKDVVPGYNPFKNKIVVVGDFRNDIHTTYTGPQPGSLIALNAYYALRNGNHFISWPLALCLAVIYFLLLLSFAFPNGAAAYFSTHRLPLWLRLVLAVVGITTLLNLVSFVAYIFGHVYNCWPAVTFFSLLTVVLKLRREWKNIKNETAKAPEKNEMNQPNNINYANKDKHETNIDRTTASAGNNDVGRTIQNPKPEPQSNSSGRQTSQERHGDDRQIGGDMATDGTKGCTEHSKSGNRKSVSATQQNVRKKGKNSSRNPRVK